MNALRNIDSFFIFSVCSVPAQPHLLRDPGTAVFAHSDPNAGLHFPEISITHTASSAGFRWVEHV